MDHKLAENASAQQVQPMTEKVDLERFRLRRFVEKLQGMNEVDVHDEQVALLDLSSLIEATDKATLFRQAGPHRTELVAAVSGSRRRIAAAFETDARHLTGEVMSRLGKLRPIVTV